MPFNLGFGEMLVFALVAILLFGGELPQIARKVGRGITDFKRGMNQHMDEIRSDIDVDVDVKVEDPPEDWEPPPQDKDCPGMG